MLYQSEAVYEIPRSINVKIKMVINVALLADTKLNKEENTPHTYTKEDRDIWTEYKKVWGLSQTGWMKYWEFYCWVQWWEEEKKPLIFQTLS